MSDSKAGGGAKGGNAMVGTGGFGFTGMRTAAREMEHMEGSEEIDGTETMTDD